MAEARTASICTDLQTMRSQIVVYKIQHNDNLPGSGFATFTEAMTGGTDSAGAIGIDYGPYIGKIPVNPFNDSVVITENGTLGDDTGGWEFNTTSGDFHADDSAAHALL